MDVSNVVMKSVQSVTSLTSNSPGASYIKKDILNTHGTRKLSNVEMRALQYMKDLPGGSHAARLMTQKDFEDLLKPTTLDDNVINTAQAILRDQFGRVGGLQDPLLGQCNEFRKQDKFIQILHVPGHWLTVTNYGAPNNTVFLLDSIGGISDSAVSQLWRILGQGIEMVTIESKPVQAQENGYDCGLFAIAHAFCIAAGRDPCSYKFDKNAMRAHVLQCICDNEFFDFPYTTAFVPRVNPKRQSFIRPPNALLSTRAAATIHYYHEEEL